MSKGPDRAVTRDDVVEHMLSRPDTREPWTASEVAEDLDVSRRVAFDRLHELKSLDRIDTKKVGANARVWWIPADADTE